MKHLKVILNEHHCEVIDVVLLRAWLQSIFHQSQSRREMFFARICRWHSEELVWLCWKKLYGVFLLLLLSVTPLTTCYLPSNSAQTPWNVLLSPTSSLPSHCGISYSVEPDLLCSKAQGPQVAPWLPLSLHHHSLTSLTLIYRFNETCKLLNLFNNFLLRSSFSPIVFFYDHHSQISFCLHHMPKLFLFIPIGSCVMVVSWVNWINQQLLTWIWELMDRKYKI